MNYFAFAVMTAFGLTSLAHAQERAAGGALDTQMTWSALSSHINSVNSKADAVNTRVDQVVVCAVKGMVYAPGGTGLDSQGCKDPKDTTNLSPINTSITNLNSSTSNIASTVNNLNTLVTNMLNCNDNGQLFDKSTNACVAPSGGFELGSYTISDASTGPFRRGVTYTANKDTLVMASKSGSGNSTCHTYAYVNGTNVIYNYGRFSSVSFIVPKGSSWRVDMRQDSYCNGAGSFSVMTLN